MEMEQRGAKIARFLSLVLGVGLIFYIGLALSLKLYFVTALAAITMIYFVSFYFLGQKAPLFTRFSFIIVSYLSILILGSSLGEAACVQYFFFSALGSCLILFSPKEKAKFIASILSAGVALLLLYVTDFNLLGLTHPPLEVQEYISRFTTLGPPAVLLAEVLLFYLVSYYYEEEIHKTISQLKNREAVLQKLEATGKIGYWDYNCSDRSVVWSDEIYRLHNVSLGRPIDADTIREVYDPEYLAKTTEKFRQIRDNEIDHFSLDVPKRGPDDPRPWLRIFGRRIVAEDGSIHIAGTTQDISELMREKIESQKTRKTLEMVFKNAPGVFYQVKIAPDGSIYMPFISDHIAQMSGVPAEAVVTYKTSLINFVHPDDRKDHVQTLKKSARELTSRSWEGRLVFPSGKTIWIRTFSIPRKDDDGSIIWDGVMVDITEHKQLEEKLRQAQIESFAANRLAALGQMAGGIAHEMNNPLFVISGFVRKMQLQLLSNNFDRQKFLDSFEKIQRTCNRMSNTIKGMLQLARQKRNEPLEVASVESIVADTLSMCEAFLKSKGVSLQLDIAPNLNILCRPTEISQVMINLINNADDAVENCEHKWIRIKARQSNDAVMITVEDSGLGIKKDIQEKLMTPFFTTKDVGKGTGLGLSICKSIMEAHHGSIRFNPAAIHTCFELKIPSSPTVTNVASTQTKVQA